MRGTEVASKPVQLAVRKFGRHATVKRHIGPDGGTRRHLEHGTLAFGIYIAVGIAVDRI